MPEKVPAGQSVQFEAVVAPVAWEYEPTAHAVHWEMLVAPTTAEYVPWGHSMQLYVSRAYEPAAHGAVPPSTMNHSLLMPKKVFGYVRAFTTMPKVS